MARTLNGEKVFQGFLLVYRNVINNFLCPDPADFENPGVGANLQHRLYVGRLLATQHQLIAMGAQGGEGAGNAGEETKLFQDNGGN